MAVDGLDHTRRLDDLMRPGWYMIRICILVELMVFTQCGFMYYMMYAGSAAKVVSCGNEPGTCTLYDAQNCTDPGLRYQFKSVNVEWDFNCSKNKIVKQAISMQMLGVLIGCVIFGQLADSYGRKKCLIATITGTAIAAFLTAYSFNLTSFTVMRTIFGFFIGGQIAIANVFMLENMPKTMRLWISMVITWSPNIIILAGVAYVTGTWDRLSIAIGMAAVPGSIIALFAIRESPRWLLQKGRVEEAKQMVIDIYNINKHAVRKEEVDSVFEYELSFMCEQNKKNKQYSFHHLFSTISLATATIVLSYGFFSISVINYGIIFNMEKLAGSIYVNSALNGCLRYFFNLIFAFAEPRVKCLGRKMIHCSSMFLIMICCGIAFYSTLSENKSIKEVNRFALIFAASMSSQAIVSGSVIGNELFPTPVRALGYSVVQTASRAGVVFAPFLFFLADIWIALPFLTLCILALIDMVVVGGLLPETKGKPMLESMPIKARKGYTLPPDQVVETATI